MVVENIEDDTCRKILSAVIDGRTMYDEVHLCISSHGGDIQQGLLLFDALRGLSFPITTHNLGYVNSAAVLLYLAGRPRLAVPDSSFTIHGTAWERASWERWTVERLKVVTERLGELDTRVRTLLQDEGHIPSRLVDASYITDQLIPVNHAVDFGLVDEVKPFGAMPGDSVSVI